MNEPEMMTFNIEQCLPLCISSMQWPIVAKHTAVPIGMRGNVVFTVRQCQSGPEEHLGQYVMYACPAPCGDIPVPETPVAYLVRELKLPESVRSLLKRWNCRPGEAQKLLDSMTRVPVGNVGNTKLWKPLDLPEGMMEQIVERAVGEVRERLAREIMQGRPAGSGLFDHLTFNVKGTMTGRHTSTKSNCEEVPKKEPLTARRKAAAFLRLDVSEVCSLPLDKLLSAIENIVALLHEYRTEAYVMAYSEIAQTQAIQMIVDLDEVKTQLNWLAEQRAKSTAGAGVSEQLARAYYDMDGVLRMFIVDQMQTIARRLKLE